MCQKLVEAPEDLGLLLIKAVRNKDTERFNDLFYRPYLWGKYIQRLSIEERMWANQNVRLDRGHKNTL